MSSPKWVTPERQAELVRLFAQSQGFCVYVNKPCQGEWHESIAVLCQWGNRCSSPMSDGKPCRYEPEQGKPRLPCHVIRIHKIRWNCAYGEYPCYKPHECHYELYTNRLIKEWVQDDRGQALAEWQAERIQLHSLGERREPLKDRFNGISRDVFYPRQPEYYLEGLGISGLTFKPFAKIQLANSYVHLYVDIENALKPVSKSKKRKVIRYGKPLPKDVSGKINEICNQAVSNYRK